MASRLEDENSLDGPEWLPDKVLEVVKMERDLNESVTDETLTERYLIRSAPVAALSVAHLSKHSADPRVRLAASTYIIDKVLGRTGVGVGLLSGANSGQSPVDQLMSKLSELVEQSD